MQRGQMLFHLLSIRYMRSGGTDLVGGVVGLVAC